MERKMIIRLIRSMTGKSHRYPALRVDGIYEILSVGVSKIYLTRKEEISESQSIDEE
jgi:hypothetical protein